MSNDLYVGRAGNGELTISNGGLVSNAGVSQGLIGYSSTGIGTVTVTGPGSQWTLGQVYVGFSGAGDLTVSAGGVVDSGNGWLARDTGSSGTALITGTDSQWSILGDVLAGYNGTGELTVADGGEVDSGYGYLGYNATGYGTATVTGTGSLWAMLYDLSVGRSGTGDLTIEDGGTVGSRYGYVGNLAGSSGTAHITGTDSLWSMSNNFYVGYRGVGEVTITDGGVVNNSTGVLGYFDTASGTVVVSGANSRWDMFNPLYVGYEGIGDLTVSDGGYVSSQHGYIGRYAGSDGTTLITGAGSEWSTSSFFVGYEGTGELTVSDGGFVSSNDGYLGSDVGGSGTATVTGAGSQWSITNGLDVGSEGIGELTIADGGVVNASFGNLAQKTGSSGTVMVTGAGSQWVMAGDLNAGILGAGELTIADGGMVSGGNASLGLNPGSSGTALVTGADSLWDLSGNLVVGQSGTGEVIIEDGGAVNSGFSLIGSGFDGSGAVTISGAGSQWSASDLFLGNGEEGVLTVVDGGTVILDSGSGTIYIAVQDIGILNIGAPSVDAAVAPGVVDAGLLNFGGGTGILAFNHTDETGTYFFAPDLATSFGGTTSAIDHYAGYTSLTGDGGAFAGTTTVYGGTLAVENMLGGDVGVMDGGTLGGSGTLSGTVSVADGGILAPGSSIGTLNVGSVTQSTGSTYAVEVDDLGNSDLLNATGTYTIESGVTLAVTPENGTDDGSTYGASTQYTIVTAAGGVTGTFDTITEDFFFLEAMASYDANNVYLTLDQVFDFVEAAMTPNQMQTAAALDSLDDADPLKDAMLMILSEEEAQDAFDQLSGEGHASMRGALAENGRWIVRATEDRLHARGMSGEETAAPQNLFWATAHGNWMDTDGSAGSHDFGNDRYGIVAGVDRSMGEGLRLGLLGGYTRTRASADTLRTDTDADSYTAGLYGGTEGSPFVIDFGALYSWHGIDGTRHITNPVSETLNADYDARSWELFGEAGYRFGANRVTAEPFVGVAHQNLETDAFAETGGVAALGAPSQSMSTTFATVGVRPVIDLAPNIQVRGMAGWRRAMGDTDTELTLGFAGSDPFTVTGAPIAESAFVSEFGFDMFAAGGVSIGASYVGQYGDGVSSNGFDLRLRTEF